MHEEKDGVQYIDQGSTMSSETTSQGLNVDELLNAVFHLSTSVQRDSSRHSVLIKIPCLV